MSVRWLAVLALAACKTAAPAKPTTVTGVGDGTPFEVAVPAGFRVNVHDYHEAESPSYATIVGPALDVYVEMMSNAPMSFAEAKASAGAPIEHAENDERGWRFFYRAPDRYEVMAMQTAAKLYCHAVTAQRADAEKALAICRSLHRRGGR